MKSKILFIFLIISVISTAQSKKKSLSFGELTERKWQEICIKANLTDVEKKTVYPIFIEYENAVFTLNKTLWDTFKRVREGKKKSQSINFAEINDIYINTEIKQANLLKNYHERLKKILSPETFFNYYMAERGFKKNLMRNISNKNKK